MALDDSWAIWVCGGLEYENKKLMRDQLSVFEPGTVLLHGEARGADMMADQLSYDLGFIRVRIPYHGPGGRAGGPIRNRIIAKLLLGLKLQGYYVTVLAFGGDRGTNDAINQARKLELDVQEFDR